jgi:hypothetical protein
MHTNEEWFSVQGIFFGHLGKNILWRGIIFDDVTLNLKQSAQQARWLLAA